MKVKTVTSYPEKKMPPLTLEVTFETEAEMLEFRTEVGPLRASGPTDPIYQAIGEHLERFTS